MRELKVAKFPHEKRGFHFFIFLIGGNNFHDVQENKKTF